LRLVWHSDLDRWSGHLFHAPHSLARLRELPRRGLVLFLSFLLRQSLSRSALVLPLENILSLAWPLKARAFFQDSGAKPPAQASPSAPLGVNFVNVAKEAGLNTKTIFGGEHKNKYLLETTGCGVAFYDYDNDGWLDIFLVNGTRLEGFPAGQEPTNRLYKNNRDGTFTDVTTQAGLVHSGWGQAVCVGDYDNDGLRTISSLSLLTSAKTSSTTTMATARSPMFRKLPASPTPTAPTALECSPPTSTTTVGPIFMSPMTPRPAASTKI
jgi:hypothetical protein